MGAIPLQYPQAPSTKSSRASHVPFACRLRHTGPIQRHFTKQFPSQQNIGKNCRRQSSKLQCKAAEAKEVSEFRSPQQHAVHTLLRRACKLAAYGLAIWAWLKISAARSAPQFCSSSLAASSSSGVSTLGSSAWAGLAAGCLHSLSGPDHLAALTPLTLGISSVKASLLGAWWGFGHCIGQLILGLLMLFLKERFHSMVPMLDKYSTLTIGLTLITIGAMGLYETFGESPSQIEATQQTPPAMQTAGGAPITIDASPGTSAQELRELSGVDSIERKSKGFSVWTLATGVVYGLQPDALFVIIPALALPTQLAAAAYMGMFVVGTVTAMGSYTAFIGATSKAIERRGTWFKVENLSAVASVIALLMGITVVFGWSFSIPALGGGSRV